MRRAQLQRASCSVIVACGGDACEFGHDALLRVGGGQAVPLPLVLKVPGKGVTFNRQVKIERIGSEVLFRLPHPQHGIRHSHGRHEYNSCFDLVAHILVAYFQQQPAAELPSIEAMGRKLWP